MFFSSSTSTLMGLPGGDDIFRLVLEYAGPSRYRFIGAVNRSWNKTYLNVHHRGALQKSHKGKGTTYAVTSEFKATIAILLEEKTEHSSWLYGNAATGTIFEAARGTIFEAARRGDMSIVQWARARHETRYSSTRILNGAACGGHLNIMKWLRANGCDWDKLTCSFAAGGGHLEVLKWARNNGCDWDSQISSEAARGGHLEVLKWARANGCNWDGWTCREAAGGGHLEVLKWARANGCEWDTRTCFEATAGGHLEVLKWARANGCRKPFFSARAKLTLLMVDLVSFFTSTTYPPQILASGTTNS